MFLPSMFLILAAPFPIPPDWPQWGGPTRDFQAPASDVAREWAQEGPRLLWKRPLGNGTAAIVVSGGRLFTLYGRARQETVVALEADTGTELWAQSYSVDYEAHREDFGGPHATPLVVGELVITVSIDAQVHAFERSTGEARWRRDLMAEHDVDLPQSGYAASPLAWGGLVILPGLGGRAPGALALDAETGRTVWARHAFLSSHASPRLIDFGGRDHVVLHGMNFLVGLAPENGDLLWRTRLRENAMDNVAFSPLWVEDRSLLVVSHCYDGKGTRGLQISTGDGDFAVDEVWSNRRLKVEHGNAVVVDDTLFASDGSESPFVVAVDLASGKARFKQRGIPKANYLAAGGKLLLLDEDGALHLALPEEDQLEVTGSIELLQSNAWTVPTLVGQRMFLRDRYTIQALELP